MEPQLPMALQVALYVEAAAIVVFVLVFAGALLLFRRRLERISGAVEELMAEMKPLVQETRVVVRRLDDLSGRAREQWMEVEGIIDTARRWSKRADYLVEEIGAAVEPPLLVATHGIGLLRRGLGIFLQVLLNRKQLRQQKARDS